MAKENIEYSYVESLGKWQCRINCPSDKPNWTYYGHGKDKIEAEKNCRKEMKRDYFDVGMGVW